MENVHDILNNNEFNDENCTLSNSEISQESIKIITDISDIYLLEKQNISINNISKIDKCPDLLCDDY